jgi:hypothetical protein
MADLILRQYQGSPASKQKTSSSLVGCWNSSLEAQSEYVRRW